MRTSINVVVTNRNVFGFGQDRVVVSSCDMYAHAAQHLAPRHAGKRARALSRALKRRGLGRGAWAGAVLEAWQICLAIMGPQWQPARQLSPVLVTA